MCDGLATRKSTTSDLCGQEREPVASGRSYSHVGRREQVDKSGLTGVEDGCPAWGWMVPLGRLWGAEGGSLRSIWRRTPRTERNSDASGGEAPGCGLPDAGERPDGPSRQGLQKNRLRPAVPDPAAPDRAKPRVSPAGVHPAARQQDPRKRDGSTNISASGAGWPNRSSMSSDSRRTDSASTREARFGTRRCASARNRLLFAARRSRHTLVHLSPCLLDTLRMSILPDYPESESLGTSVWDSSRAVLSSEEAPPCLLTDSKGATFPPVAPAA